MSAKDYTLAVTPLTNTVWICKPSKRNNNTMTNDRKALPSSDFINAILNWTVNQLREDQDEISITEGEKVVAKIWIDRKEVNV